MSKYQKYKYYQELISFVNKRIKEIRILPTMGIRFEKD